MHFPSFFIVLPRQKDGRVLSPPALALTHHCSAPRFVAVCLRAAAGHYNKKYPNGHVPGLSLRFTI
jgi:hypothetical protein